MRIQITSHRIDVTDAMATYIEEKFAKFERYLSHLDEDQKQALVTVRHVKGIGVRVNFVMHLPPKHQVYAEKEGNDFYMCVDALRDAVGKELERYHEKRTEAPTAS